MKKVTVTLSDDLARWVEGRAEENNRSVPEWIVGRMETMRRQEDDYDVAMNRFLARAREPRELQWVDGRKPTREELHDRAALRRHPAEEDAGDG
ncbi:MAG: hypothetical protein OXG35_32855 [Acidobacteria bacterium]|nr:hypothetical protein [Acidobacteriota bacterium]